MNFKVLIYFLSFSCLLYFATGSSEDAPNPNSVNSDAEHPDDGGSREQQNLLDLETKQSAAQREVPFNATDASPPLQLTADGRIGELQLSEDNGRSVDVIWQIPNFLILPYRKDAGIISPDFDIRGFKGFFVLDPKGPMNRPGMMSINSLILRKDKSYRKSYLQVFLKAEDGTLKSYVPSVSFRNYFTCNIPKRDIIVDKESMVPGGVLTVVFRLSFADDESNRNPEVTPSLASKNDVGDLNAHRISSSKFAMTWVFEDFFNLPEYRQLTGTLPRISPYFFFHIYLIPKGIYSTAGFTRLQLSWRYTGDVPPERKVPYPKFSCKFSLKTRENTLYNMTQEKYHVALHGGYCDCLIPWSEIYEQKDFLVPRGELELILNFDLESKDVEPETQTEVSSNPTDASSSLHQLTTDGRVGELQLSEDNDRSVDIIWRIPNFLILPYRNDAGIISPDFDSRGFKGFFAMDPKGSINTSGMMSINSLIISKNGPSSYLQVFLKAEDGTLKTYVPSVSFSNYFTCNIPKMDIIGDKESMVAGGVLTILFKLTLVYDVGNSNPKITPSLSSMHDVGDLNARRISSSKFAVTWVFQDFFSLPEYRQLTGTLPQISPDFFFHIYFTPKGRFDEAGFTMLQLSWRYTGDVPPERKVPYPKFSCKFSLKTRDNTLYNMTQEKYHVALHGGYCDCLIPWSEIYEQKDSLVPGGELELIVNFDLESKDVEPETQTDAPSNPTDASPSLQQLTADGRIAELQLIINAPSNPTDASLPLQLTTDRRIGELQLSEDNGRSVDVIWKIPNFLKLPYRNDAGIISPDFDSRGFKGFFVMDPKGSMNTSGMMSINSLIIPKNGPSSYVQVFLKAEDGTLKTYVPSVSFSNYFTCNVAKMDIIGDKESMVPRGVLTVLFKLSLVDDGSDSNPEITPILASQYDVGDLNAHRISSSKFAVTWVFPDFFSLPEYRQLTGTLLQNSPDFFFHIYLTPKGRFSEAGYTRLQLSWRYAGDVPSEKKNPYPKFSCKFSLKTRDNTLYNMTQEKYHVALYGGFCYCLVPLSKIYEGKDVLVPGGELALILNFDLESKDIKPETQTDQSSPATVEEEKLRTVLDDTVTGPTTTSHRENIKNRIGEIQISRDTQNSVDITWTINGFFTLSYQPESGILSPDFSSLGFKGFFVMDPKGSATTPGDLQIRSVIFRHDVPRGKIYFKLFLKMLNGTFTEFPVTVPFDNYFTSDISKLKIVEEKDSLAPGGVLTVLFRLSTTGNFGDNFKRECDCKSEKKESEDCDSRILIPFLKMSSDFLGLYKTGAHSDATLMCGDKKFAVHKSILTARSSVFADMFKRDANGNAIDQTILEIEDVVTLTDIGCSILDILLQYIYSARVGNITSDEEEQLIETAKKYGVE